MTMSLAPPSAARISRFEAYYEIRLPEDYKEFLARSNGIIPTHRCFTSCLGEQVIERFLPLLDDPNLHPEWGQYDVAVVTSQLDIRLADGSSEFGLQFIPIAELFAGDFLVLDYSWSKDAPRVALWQHEASKEFEPVTHPLCATFSDLLGLLRECGSGAALK
jgi:hypothetical protein